MNKPIFFEKLSINARKILRASIEVARESGAREVEPHHLLTALLLERNTLGHILLEQCGIHLEENAPEMPRGALRKASPSSKMEPPLSGKTQRVIASAFLLAHRFSYPYVGSEHLVHALIESNDPHVAPLFLLRKNSDKNRKTPPVLPNFPFNLPEFPGFARMMELPDIEFISGQPGNSKTPTLSEYGIRLGRNSSRKSFRSRSKEIESVLRTLGRKTKSNPLLLGDPGVGKTTIVEAVAECLASNEAGHALHETEIILLDLPALVAGTSYRGEFEARLKDVIRETREHPNIILFLDEIHTLIGAGNASGALDAANILKPALSRGDIRCIGATTFAEYKRHIEKDPALERRFQPIRISEPTAEATIHILEESRIDYETHHHIDIGKDALHAAVTLSIRHLPGRFLPDKAFDILDEAASLLRRRTEKNKDTKRHIELLRAHKNILAQKSRLVREQKFEKAEALRQEEIALEHSLRALSEKETHRERAGRPTLTEEHVSEAVALMTETPLEHILRAKTDSLVPLLPKLSEMILGQDEALSILSRNIIRSRLRLEGRSDRPAGSFLFLGPSGVGKTFTARILAETLFGTKKSFIRFDMSEFRERHTMAQMIGSPAGYVGFGEGGKLTEHIRHSPASVVLFDEIEKAHPDVLNLLLQILEEGVLTDAEGRKAHFGESLIILTSNIGTESFQKETRLGFGGNVAPSFEALRDATLRELSELLRPELLARLDQRIVFRPLASDTLAKLATRELDRLATTLKHHHIQLRFAKELAEFIGMKSFAEQGGARAVRRVMGNLIEDPLAELLVKTGRPLRSVSLSPNAAENRVIFKGNA